ncbi:hypothetical protein FHR57_000642 [Xanthomonas arboricola]|nr:hypothetical protein [Xanthomonas arboricola]
MTEVGAAMYGVSTLLNPKAAANSRQCQPLYSMIERRVSESTSRRPVIQNKSSAINYLFNRLKSHHRKNIPSVRASRKLIPTKCRKAIFNYWKTLWPISLLIPY